MRQQSHLMLRLIVLAGVAAMSPPILRAADTALSPEELAAAFAAAGFAGTADGRYIRCREDPVTLSYQSGQAAVTDLNGDGQPEVWITEGSTFCYGNTGSAFVLLTRDGGGWRKLLDEVGMQIISDTKHNGWPDIEVGGPGFQSFPVFRWDGKRYVPAD